MADFKFLIDIVDTVSPMVTMAFGIYGSLNHTKPVDGKLTRKGNIAIWGIIISGIITITVKSGNLYYKVQAQKAEQVQHHIQDSLQAAFQDSVAKKFERSINSLDSIKNSNVKTLSSLNNVADKEQATLQNTQRGMNPIFPIRVEIDFTVDMNAFYKKSPLDHYRGGINKYVDTLAFFAMKNEIPNIIARQRHTGGALDTLHIPKPDEVDPLLNHAYFEVPENVLQQFDYFKNAFAGLFLVKSFAVNFRKINVAKPQITLSFKLDELVQKILKREATEEENDKLHVDLNIKEQLLHIFMAADNPEIINMGGSDSFISLYDLRNAVIGITINNTQLRAPDIFKINSITFYTGFKLSRKTIFQFTAPDINNTCCGEAYARVIKPEEIK